METWLGPHRTSFYALLRIVAGCAFAEHGAQKLFGLLGGTAQPLFSQMGFAGIVEFIGGILIAIGLFASPVAFIAGGQMAWAFFQNHLPRGFWPIQNGGELAVVYCFLWLFVAATGSGKWSVDALRK